MGGGQEVREKAEVLGFWEPGAQGVMSTMSLQGDIPAHIQCCCCCVLSDGEPADFMNGRTLGKVGEDTCWVGPGADKGRQRFSV